MSKTFFDIGSKNTFRDSWYTEYDWRFNKPIERIPEFPKWLTLPVHYQGTKPRPVYTTQHGDSFNYFAKEGTVRIPARLGKKIVVYSVDPLVYEYLDVEPVK